jgi:hypothetical protein
LPVLRDVGLKASRKVKEGTIENDTVAKGLQQHQREAKNQKHALRAPGNGARIRSLHAESSRNQVSLLILVHTNAIHEQLQWGHQ